MKRSKFSEAQIVLVLKQAEERAAIGEVCRKAGIGEARQEMRARQAREKRQ